MTEYQIYNFIFDSIDSEYLVCIKYEGLLKRL